MTLRLLLIRHGLSSYNCENRIQGRSDLSTLTEEGLYQSRQIGKILQGIKVDAVYSSPLQRAADTSKELLKEKGDNIDISFKEDLMEVDLSKWSGLTAKEVQNQYPNEYEVWRTNPINLLLKKETGENYYPIKDLFNQANNFIKDLSEIHNPSKNNTVLIIGHNAILRSLILQLLNNPNNGIRKIKLDNASISILNLIPSNQTKYNVQIESLNQISHLTKKLHVKGKGPRLILVRHGETNWNREGRFQGQIDIPLNTNGHSQANSAGHFLKDISINKAFSSSMSRPLETAKIILKHHSKVQIKLEKDLMEINHGEWEGKLESEINEQWQSLLKLWKESPEKVIMPNGESIEDVKNRSVKCWERICDSLSPNDTALVVAHDAVNKAILCHLLGLGPENIWTIKQGNGGITIIDIPEKNLQPSLITCMNITSNNGGVFDQTAHGAL